MPHSTLVSINSYMDHKYSPTVYLTGNKHILNYSWLLVKEKYKKKKSHLDIFLVSFNSVYQNQNKKKDWKHEGSL